MTKTQRYQEAEMALHEAAVEFARYWDNGHKTWGELALIEAALAYTWAADKVTEQEADRNAALGRAERLKAGRTRLCEMNGCWERGIHRGVDGLDWCERHKAYTDVDLLTDLEDPADYDEAQIARREYEGNWTPRPCCHTTGPNHHPACTTKEAQ